MKVKVIRTFRDKDNFDLIYNVGEILDLDDERAKELIELNLVEKPRERKKVKE
nr:MAG TPA: hypothetical protein [Caudoviricetes sp.]